VKRKLNRKKIVLTLILLIIIFYLLLHCIFGNIKINWANVNSVFNNCSNYDIIKQDTNSNYSGIGQEKILYKDGYDTIFTTSNHQIYKEYKQNGNSSWSSLPYWDNTMETDGCGITALAIILSGYGKSISPGDLRERYYPVLKGDCISSELSKTFAISNSDFAYDKERLSSSYIENHLKSNRPVLICVWNKPTANRWTTASHYMVLLATDNHGMVYVSNPNGLSNTAKSSGWYSINEITPYLAKALFIEKSF